MAKRSTKIAHGRRALLRLIALAPAAAWLGGTAGAGAAPRPGRAGCGYRRTAHVRTVYRLARF